MCYASFEDSNIPGATANILNVVAWSLFVPDSRIFPTHVVVYGVDLTKWDLWNGDDKAYLHFLSRAGLDTMEGGDVDVNQDAMAGEGEGEGAINDDVGNNASGIDTSPSIPWYLKGLTGSGGEEEGKSNSSPYYAQNEGRWREDSLLQQAAAMHTLL
jgi:hypothetical protein